MTPESVRAFCFPADLDADLDRHIAYWRWMMRGGADEGIVARFSDLVTVASQGALNDWARTPNGRLALILVLDQFPRSVFRGRATAYEQDRAALTLTEDGLQNGHFAALEHPWERTLYALPLVHAEGPGFRARAATNVALARETLAGSPEMLKPAYAFCLSQSLHHQAVLDEFGRHPHRNDILGRPSTAAELTYLAAGEFPHQRDVKTG